jgi:hypothetical protein
MIYNSFTINKLRGEIIMNEMITYETVAKLAMYTKDLGKPFHIKITNPDDTITHKYGVLVKYSDKVAYFAMYSSNEYKNAVVNGYTLSQIKNGIVELERMVGDNAID